MTTQRRTFSDAEKLQLINEYLASGESKEVFQTKRHLGHNNLSRWMLTFGISNQSQPVSMINPKEEDAYTKQLHEEIALSIRICNADALSISIYNALIQYN